MNLAYKNKGEMPKNHMAFYGSVGIPRVYCNKSFFVIKSSLKKRLSLRRFILYFILIHFTCQISYAGEEFFELKATF